MDRPDTARKPAAAAAIALGLVLAALTGAAAREPVSSAYGRGLASGPDVIVGELNGLRHWGEVGGVTAYSVGTTSCNVGDEVLPWDADTPAHPVIAQNLYRLKGGRFEQIGMSWLKHGFAAQTGILCDMCQDPFNSQLLGVGCSDVYSADLNGRRETVVLEGGLGPRSEVDAATGVFPYPYCQVPYCTQGETGDAVFKRLQVRNADLDPAQNPGARYFVEGHYVTAADAAAGNDDNNASYREVTVGPAPTYFLSFAGDTEPEKPAVLAWRDADPQVAVAHVDVPGDGRFTLAARATALGGGVWRYAYALYNMNSHRSARGFTVPLVPGASVQTLGFRDVEYHSGEPYDGTDWTAAVDPMAGTVSWTTELFAADPDANALRWGTLYSFWLDTGVPPGSGDAVIDLFRPGAPATVPVATVAPAAGIFADGFESGDTVAWSFVSP